MTWPAAIAAIRTHANEAVRTRALKWCEENQSRFPVPTCIQPTEEGGLYIDFRNRDGKLKHAVEFMPEGDELQEWRNDRIVSTEVIKSCSS